MAGCTEAVGAASAVGNSAAAVGAVGAAAPAPAPLPPAAAGLSAADMPPGMHNRHAAPALPSSQHIARASARQQHPAQPLTCAVDARL